MANIVDETPLWLLFLGTLLLVGCATEIGHRLGTQRRKKSEQEKVEPVGAMGGTVLGLLAFMLAFTFGVAANRFDNRRELALKEANAIGTCYLRADLLPDDERVRVRKLLREYIDTRVAWASTEDAGRVHRSSAMLQTLWTHAKRQARTAPDSEVTSLFIDSVNTVIDLHEERVLARSHVPGTIWAALYLLTVLAFLTSGYHSGLHRSSRSPVMFVIALSFAIVIALIADLDRPMDGLISVDQRAMRDLKQEIEALD